MSSHSTAIRSSSLNELFPLCTGILEDRQKAKFHKIDQITFVALKVIDLLPKNMETLLKQNGLETGNLTKGNEAVALANRFITLLSNIQGCLRNSLDILDNQIFSNSQSDFDEITSMRNHLSRIKDQFRDARLNFDGNAYLDKHLGPTSKEPSTSLCGRVFEYFFGRPQISRISLESDVIYSASINPIFDEWAGRSFDPKASGYENAFEKTVENWIKAKLQPSSQSAADSITGTDSKED